MMFAFIVVILAPLLVASTASVSQDAAKITYYPKPSAWMVKPTSESDKPFRPSTYKPRDTYVNDYTYWLVHTYYTTTDYYNCNEDDAIMKIGYASNQCYQTGPDSSVMYWCYSQYNCQMYQYPVADCSTYVIPTYVYTNWCKAGAATDDGFVTDDGSQFYNQQLIVQQGFPVPLPGNSTTLSTYSSGDCSQYSMTSYTLAYPDLCYNNFDGQNRTSTQYINPELISYTGNGCAETNVTSSTVYLPGMCQSDNSTTSSSNSTTSATSSMLVLNFPVAPKIPIDLATILGTTAAAFSTMAIANTLFYFFQPALSEATQSANMQAEKPSEF